MLRDTNDLIQHLAATASPVRPLSRPWRRAAGWLACALPYVALVTLLWSVRPDWSATLFDPRFVAEAATALLMAAAAAAAAFATVVPGYNRKALVLVLVPFALWLGVLGRGCLQDIARLGPEGLVLRTDWSCFPAILLTGAVPTIAMAVMLRRGAPLTPTLTMVLGGLGAAALADFGMRFHHREAGPMVLVWHLAAIVVLLTIAGRTGRHVLRWREPLM